jgi:hypothetical protein
MDLNETTRDADSMVSQSIKNHADATWVLVSDLIKLTGI